MYYLISNIFICVCAFVSFILGAVRFLKARKALYAVMIVLGVGCIAYGRLYQVVRLIVGGNILGEFQLGILGVVGSLMFFFSANFGTMDTLADDGSKSFKKYRIIALAAPILALLLYLVFMLFADISLLWKIIGAVLCVFVMQTTYFNLKHLIFPDVDFGVIKCLKPYNALAIVYAFLCIAEAVAMSRENEVFTLAVGVLTGITVLAIVPMLRRGVKQWTA